MKRVSARSYLELRSKWPKAILIREERGTWVGFIFGELSNETNVSRRN